jgi:hypothetical protein
MYKAVLVGAVALVIVAGFGLGGDRSVAKTEPEFKSSIAGLPAGLNGTAAGTIRGVASAGAPWVAMGDVDLNKHGRLRVDVEGLLLDLPGQPGDGTTGPVTGVRASLTCQNGDVVATTGVVPLSAAGDAEIKETISVPSSCVGPIVLIRIGRIGTGADILGPWIAANGF